MLSLLIELLNHFLRIKLNKSSWKRDIHVSTTRHVFWYRRCNGFSLTSSLGWRNHMYVTGTIHLLSVISRMMKVIYFSKQFWDWSIISEAKFRHKLLSLKYHFWSMTNLVRFRKLVRKRNYDFISAKGTSVLKEAL